MVDHSLVLSTSCISSRYHSPRYPSSPSLHFATGSSMLHFASFHFGEAFQKPQSSNDRSDSSDRHVSACRLTGNTLIHLYDSYFDDGSQWMSACYAVRKARKCSSAKQCIFEKTQCVSEEHGVFLRKRGVFSLTRALFLAIRRVLAGPHGQWGRKQGGGTSRVPGGLSG